MKKSLLMGLALISLNVSAMSIVDCVKILQSDKDLEINGSSHALNICRQYSSSQILCAKDLDNRGVENNFPTALKICSESREVVRCTETIMTDPDLEKNDSHYAEKIRKNDSLHAVKICKQYGTSIVNCAKDLDNRGVINNFLNALKVCSESREAIRCTERIMTDKDLEKNDEIHALSMCKRYGEGVIKCAQELDNMGIENTFSQAIKICEADRTVVSTPIPDVVVRHVDRHNPMRDSFRDDAYWVAETTIGLVESLENYANSEERAILLSIKKQAARLSARVQGRSNLKTVRNTTYHLGTLLNDSSDLFEDALERGALFHVAKDLMTVKERIKSMISFMDDFKGNESDLY